MLQNYPTKSLRQSLILKAKAELELRRRYKQKSKEQNHQLFEDWLVETSPHFKWDYSHLLLIQKHLDEIVDGKQKHIMIIMPPQHGKSLHTTIHFPAYFLERFPQKRIIIGAYNSEYASKFSMAAKRLLIKRNFKFGDMNHANEWNTTRDGFLKSFGLLSGITGTPADLIIIDDPIKNVSEARSKLIRDKIWDEFEYSIESRQQPHTSFIIILTRWHHDDLIGRLLKRDGKDAWDIIHLPALALDNDPIGRKVGEPLCVDRKTKEKLEKEKQDNPSKFAALYQGNPTIDGGNIIKEEYFVGQGYSNLPKMNYVLLSVDTNSKPTEKGSYAVIMSLGVRDSNVYLMDVWREKCDYVKLKKMVLYKNELYKPTYILIEEKVNGCPLVQELKTNTMLPIKAVQPHGSKEVRLEACTPMFENKKIFVPDKAPWLYDYISEMVNFPTGDNDDQVDATSQALSFIQFNSSNYYKSLCS